MTTNNTAPPRAQPKPLGELIEIIRSHHRAVGRAGIDLLAAAMAAGDALAAARRQVPRGGWELWVQSSCGLSLRTVQAYIRLANHRFEIEAKAQSSAPWSLAAALKLIARPRPAKARSKKPAAPLSPLTDRLTKVLRQALSTDSSAECCTAMGRLREMLRANGRTLHDIEITIAATASTEARRAA